MKMAYLHAGPHTDDLRDFRAPLFFVLLCHFERFWVGGIGEVIVHVLFEKRCVQIFEALVPLGYEFELWGRGHWDEAIGGDGVLGYGAVGNQVHVCTKIRGDMSGKVTRRSLVL